MDSTYRFKMDFYGSHNPAIYASDCYEAGKNLLNYFEFLITLSTRLEKAIHILPCPRLTTFEVIFWPFSDIISSILCIWLLS